MTFKQHLCLRLSIPESEYERTVLRLTLYPQARYLWPLLRYLGHDRKPDLDFIEGVARITQLKELAGEVSDYQLDPRNEGFLRTTLSLRISVRNMVSLVSEVMGIKIEGTVDSRSPLGDFQG